MVNVDVDNDVTRFGSSSATVDIPVGGAVLSAALTWGCGGSSVLDRVATTGVAADEVAPTAPHCSAAGTVQFKGPGCAACEPAKATSLGCYDLGDDTSDRQGYAVVTDSVQMGGFSTVAYVQTAEGPGRYAGWALIIAYSAPLGPACDLRVMRAFGGVSQGQERSVDVVATGLAPAPDGGVATTIGAVAFGALAPPCTPLAAVAPRCSSGPRATA